MLKFHGTDNAICISLDIAKTAIYVFNYFLFRGHHRLHPRRKPAPAICPWTCGPVLRRRAPLAAPPNLASPSCSVSSLWRDRHATKGLPFLGRRCLARRASRLPCPGVIWRFLSSMIRTQIGQSISGTVLSRAMIVHSLPT